MAKAIADSVAKQFAPLKETLAAAGTLNTINLEDVMPSKMNMPEVTKLTSLDSVSAILPDTVNFDSIGVYCCCHFYHSFLSS